MFSSSCTKCNGKMIIDTLATVHFYDINTDLIIDKDGKPTIEYLPNVIILRCQKCGYQVTKSFIEIINEMKFFFLKILSTNRQLNLDKGIDKSILKEESGMSYCGMCPGPFDGDGYCLNDMKKLCGIRKACIARNNSEI